MSKASEAKAHRDLARIAWRYWPLFGVSGLVAASAPYYPVRLVAFCLVILSITIISRAVIRLNRAIREQEPALRIIE